MSPLLLTRYLQLRNKYGIIVNLILAISSLWLYSICIAPELKLDDKAETMIHMGYSLRSKGYHLYVLVKRDIVICRDVIFDESKLHMPVSSQVVKITQILK